MANQNAEQRARDRIDAQLREAGWTVQNAVAMNLNAADGIAVRELEDGARLRQGRLPALRQEERGRSGRGQTGRRHPDWRRSPN